MKTAAGCPFIGIWREPANGVDRPPLLMPISAARGALMRGQVEHHRMDSVAELLEV